MYYEDSKESVVLEVFSEDEGKRLDKLILERIDNLNRNQVKRLIEGKNIVVNFEENKAKAGYKVKPGDKIEVKCSFVQKENDWENAVNPEPISIEIIYEDENILIINKPKNMVVHPAPGNLKGTLVNALLYHYDELSTLGGKFRPGIVHRLDKDTSGIMLIAKNNVAHEYFKDKFKNREVTKEYLALCKGKFLAEEKTIEAPIARHPKDRKKMAVIDGGRYAKTYIKFLNSFKFKGDYYSYIKALPITGRTHQIRVHLSYLGHPLVGDETYGKTKKNKLKIEVNGQALHAFKLRFYHPFKEREMVMKASLPEYFSSLLKWLGGLYK